MEESFQTFATLQLVISVVMAILFVAVVGTVILRFKTTVSGLLIAVAYGGFALLIVLSWLIFRLFMRGASSESFMIVSTVMDIVDFILTLTLAVGIGFIPRSLRRMKEARSGSR